MTRKTEQHKKTLDLPKEIADLIKSSGNTFHARVARSLERAGWHITVSPYYMDQAQNKAREIDLVAEKAWPRTNYWGDYKGELVVRLFIECKYLGTHSVFWFSGKDDAEARKLAAVRCGLDTKDPQVREHHYVAQGNSVAKLFASTGKGQDTEPFYKALNQTLNAMVSMSRKPALLPSLRKDRGALKIVDFPVVVCSSFDRLWALDFYEDSTPWKMQDNFQLEVRYAYTDYSGAQKNDYFLLDVVEFAQIEAFLEVITKDASIMSKVND